MHEQCKSVEIRRVVLPADEPPNLRNRVANYTARWRANMYGSSTPTIADLALFAQENSAVPIENPDQAYVIGFEAPDAFGDDGIPKFRLILSSQRLLRHVPVERLVQIQTDATYKLIWQGFPVFVLGFSDANKKLHPIAFAICSHNIELVSRVNINQNTCINHKGWQDKGKGHID
jgi:hypothetical protein